MRVSVIADDRTIVVDGEALRFDFVIDPAIWAIQWYVDHGEIEWRGQAQPHTEITELSDIQPYIDAFQAEQQRRADAVAAALAARPLADVQARKLAELVEECDGALAGIRDQYPEVERQTWPDQEREARTWLAWHDGGAVGPEPATPTLTGIAAARGLTMLDLCGRVVAKADAYRAAAVAAIGYRQALEDQVSAIMASTATDDEKRAAIEAITW